MADKMATRQDAKTIGGKGEADNKLITYQEISDYGCAGKIHPGRS